LFDVCSCSIYGQNHKEEEAIEEISRAIGFKADLQLLHLHTAAFHELKGDVCAKYPKKKCNNSLIL